MSTGFPYDLESIDLFLLPTFSVAWAGVLGPILKTLLNRDAECAGCVCPFCSFHHLIPLVKPLGCSTAFECGSGWRNSLCQFSCMSFKPHRLILKVNGKCQLLSSFLLQTATGWMHALLQWSMAKVISEGLSGFLCKPFWTEATREKQSAILIAIMYLSFLRGLETSMERSEKGRQRLATSRARSKTGR